MVARKWCFVPGCMNTTIKTPTKIFVSVPKQKRNEWFIAVKRDIKEVSATTTLYCCEDHFNLEEDMENYLQYKFSKVKARIKGNVVPHIFLCQPDAKAYEKLRLASQRRAHKKNISEMLRKPTESWELAQQPSISHGVERGFQSCESIAELKVMRNVGTQTRNLTHFRSKGTQASFPTLGKNMTTSRKSVKKSALQNT